ncbi:hypothetical protein BW730_17770 [Tessaracoccus aquimaris]|uniref:N-acetyltransferase domain-containing protein n=1 Tax=Tessaracoccus aquimaris TaxID=1332264 RepID=A0A1Q2CSH2_9ACTN|nr:hypothetical protein [Tessaracoccus aquimaris]AQP49066.1 hypothetical protein BW730_17770 [Tessaracoccus aquimaris]
MPWLEIIGWVGSGLVVWSLMVARVIRFRWMNLAGSAIATVYNGVIGVWPFMAMNAIIAVIDIYWLFRLYREKHDAGVFDVVEVGADDAYLRRVLDFHADDIAATAPNFRPDAVSADCSSWLVVRGDETVGAVLVTPGEPGEAKVELDWVTPRFRDFTPGEFVHSRSGIFAAKGYERVVVENAPESEAGYLSRVGFTRDGARWVRPVVAPAA